MASEKLTKLAKIAIRQEIANCVILEDAEDMIALLRQTFQ